MYDGDMLRIYMRHGKIFIALIILRPLYIYVIYKPAGFFRVYFFARRFFTV